MSYEDALARAVEDVVAPSAEDVDRNGVFPRASLDALAFVIVDDVVQCFRR